MSIAVCYPPNLSIPTLNLVLSWLAHDSRRAPNFCRWLSLWLKAEKRRRQSVALTEVQYVRLPELERGELATAVVIVDAWLAATRYQPMDFVSLLERLHSHLQQRIEEADYARR